MRTCVCAWGGRCFKISEADEVAELIRAVVFNKDEGLRRVRL